MRRAIIEYLESADEGTLRLVWFFLFGKKGAPQV